MSWSDHVWLLAGALVLDWLVGDPDWLWRRMPHPVAWFGALIATLDRRLNDERLSPAARRTRGTIALALLVAVALVAGWVLHRVFVALPFGWVPELVVVAVFLAARSLQDHVAAVARAFAGGGLDAARAAVSRIVGRDPATLDEAGVCRAAIESSAENFSDGVVAPVIWYGLLGLPGLLAYKAINTADSMIGHRSPRHVDFGRAAALTDDLVNWPASRGAAALLALAAPVAGGRIAEAWAVVRRDARRHRSPNAGWPEAAMAGALWLALAGPRTYAGKVVDDPFLNESGRRAAAPADIARALKVYRGANLALFVAVVALAVVTS